MAKKLAIDWDDKELRFVAGRTTPGGVTITDAGSVPIEGEGNQGIAQTLQRVLQERGLTKLPTLVAIGRGRAELRQLKLPPIPDDELPEVVRFQAIRNFAAAGERAVVDFVPARRGDDSVEVVAAAVAPEQLDEIRQLVQPHVDRLERIVLRPLAAASLFTAYQSTGGEVVLLDVLADDADLVILRDGRPLFVRSVRLPIGGDARSTALASEVRRSLMACRIAADPQQPARRIILWGRADVHADDILQLGQRLGCTLETLDPLAMVGMEDHLRSSEPEHVGRLAPLVGLLAADVRGADLLIDFLNPRKKPQPRNDRARYAVMGAAAAAVLLMVGYTVWSSLNSRDRQIAELQKSIGELETQLKETDVHVANVARIDQFLDGNVIWVEELRRLAEKLPPAEQAILTNLTASAQTRTGGGQMTLTGKVTTPEVKNQLESQLRDELHRVDGRGISPTGDSAYPWLVNETVLISPEAVRQMRRAGIRANDDAPPADDAAAVDAAADADQPAAAVDQAPASDPPRGAPPAAKDAPPDTPSPPPAADQSASSDLNAQEVVR